MTANNIDLNRSLFSFPITEASADLGRLFQSGKMTASQCVKIFLSKPIDWQNSYWYNPLGNSKLPLEDNSSRYTASFKSSWLSSLKITIAQCIKIFRVNAIYWRQICPSIVP
jgi:hypothetical protein